MSSSSSLILFLFMAILTVIQEPHPLLHQKSEAVHVIDESIINLLKDMEETMVAKGGIGLAAVQVGILKRVVVMDVPTEEEMEEASQNDTNLQERRDKLKKRLPHPTYLINPKIKWASKETVPYVEDCLSVPISNHETMKIAIERPAEVSVTYLDENGQEKEKTYRGLEATCIQHEIDHTNGILYIDHFPSMSRDVVKRKLKRACEN